MTKVGIGQDSHAFDFDDTAKKLVLGGVVFQGEHPLRGNSDADVVLHSLTNAVSGVTGVNVLGKVSDDMCRRGITDSREYLQEALKSLNGYRIVHVSLSIECLRPMISPRMDEMKRSVAGLLSMKPADVAVTATTGEGLTAFGRGEGIQVFSVVTAMLHEDVRNPTGSGPGA